MGLDLFVYTASDMIVTTEELVHDLRVDGWDTRLVLVEAKPGLEPAPDGPLDDILTVIGWPVGSDRSAAAAGAIMHRDLNAVQSLYKEGAVGSCGLSVVGNYSFDDEDADLEEDAEDDEPVEAWGLEAMKQARVKYVLLAGTRDNKTSYQLLDAVWRALGRLRGGLLFDPQSCEFRRVS